MKRYYSIIFISAICSLLAGQQIAEIIEYKPAPGQWINTASGNPAAAESLSTSKGGLVSLGGYGGYIIMRLASPILNDPGNPYGVDFTIFGNALPHWAEPGIVAVMKDENGNGLPDESWYELAGSDHFFPGTINDYTISYRNPHADAAADIPWSDNQGRTGLLLKNVFQNQDYYPDPDVFPGIGEEKCEFSGTLINPVLDFSNPLQSVSHARLFGYADNNVRIDPTNPLPDNPYEEGSENSGGDAMDISWAIDEEGQYVDLDQVDFIKVYSSVNANGGILGEVSTELSLLVNVEASAGYPIPEKVIAVKGLPLKIIPEAYELEYAVFINGRYAAEETVNWSCDAEYSRIDSEYYLLAEGEETISITAILDSDSEISVSFSTEVYKPAGAADVLTQEARIYPNPCTDYVMIDRQAEGEIKLLSLQGRVIYKETVPAGTYRLELGTYPPGMYIIVSGDEQYKIVIKR